MVTFLVAEMTDLLEKDVKTRKIFSEVKEKELVSPDSKRQTMQSVLNRLRKKEKLAAIPTSFQDLMNLIDEWSIEPSSPTQGYCMSSFVDDQDDELQFVILLTTKSKYDFAPKLFLNGYDFAPKL